MSNSYVTVKGSTVESEMLRYIKDAQEVSMQDLIVTMTTWIPAASMAVIKGAFWELVAKGELDVNIRLVRHDKEYQEAQ